MTVYEKIRFIRQLNKMTQTEFGDSMGLSKATISNFETGRAPIPAYVVTMLRLIYNIDPDWLFDETQEDFEKRYFIPEKGNTNSILLAYAEKFSRLDDSYRKIVMKLTDELLEHQEGKSGMKDTDEKENSSDNT
jgi:transcriptional regulator with XRE-family HTH domain